jgi:hypothetical protein
MARSAPIVIESIDLVKIDTPLLDISAVTALDSVALEVKKQERGLPVVDNSDLVRLADLYPKKVAHLLSKPGNHTEQIARLKEKYGLVIKEIEGRKDAAVIAAEELMRG